MDAWSVSRERNFTPVEADMEAIRCALILAQQRGWRKLEVKLDVKALVTSLQLGKNPTLESLTIAEDIFLLKDMFEDCNFGFEHKRFNKTCNRLASFALYNLTSYAWGGRFPDWLKNVVQQDFRSVGLV